MKYIYKPPVIAEKILCSSHWKTNNNKILLTFDDGPSPAVTPVILNKLKEYNLKALFFCVGDNIKRYPELTIQMLEEGHSIGNHTFHHKRATRLSRGALEIEIDSVNRLVEKTFNYRIKYFRPPYGRISFSLSPVLKGFEMENVMWSLLTADYKNNINLVKSNVYKYLANNSIVALHDNIKCADIISDSIDFVVNEAVKREYLFGEPDECLS